MGPAQAPALHEVAAGREAGLVARAAGAEARGPARAVGAAAGRAARSWKPKLRRPTYPRTRLSQMAR